MSCLPHICIELTRRCNLRCRHCLRGEPEQVNLDFQKLETAFKECNVEEILAVTLSGGEPSLNVSGIFEFGELIRDLGIRLEYFYLATNGTNDSLNFFNAVRSCFWATAHPNECILAISRTSFHFESMRKRKIPIPSMANLIDRMGPAFGDRVYTMGLHDSFEIGLVNEGRHKGAPDAVSPREPGIFMNVFCEVFNYSDISYETQRQLVPMSLKEAINGRRNYELQRCRQINGTDVCRRKANLRT